VVSNENVLEAIVKPVSKVEYSGDIWRRNNYYVRFFARLGCPRFKSTSLFPILVNAVLKVLRIIGFV
jgi:hypothetical protein